MKSLLFFVVYLFSIAQTVAFDEKFVIEKDVCPFECCAYRTWYAEKDMAIYASADLLSPEIASIVKGEEVQALTGEMHIHPSRFLFTKAHWSGYQAGDLVWILHSEGEGEYKAWNGREKINVVFIDPSSGWDVGQFDCTAAWAPINCSGTLVEPLNSTWWARVRTRSGITGWTMQPRDFSNTDACG